MLNFEQEVKLGIELGGWSVNLSDLKTVDLTKEGISATYIYENSKGGRQIIVGSDGKVLIFSSALSLDKVLYDMKYNNLWEKAVDSKTILK